MWMGWASSVKLWNSHISTFPRAGFSVMRSFHVRALPVPSGLSVPSRADVGPKTSPLAQSRTMLPFCSDTLTLWDSSSLSEVARVTSGAPRGAFAGSTLGRMLVSGLVAALTVNFITRPVDSQSDRSSSEIPLNGASGPSLTR
jgi:hypothetical protein